MQAAVQIAGYGSPDGMRWLVTGCIKSQLEEKQILVLMFALFL